MGEVVYLDGAIAGAMRTIAPSMRQPGEDPVSQCVSLGMALDNLLERLEGQMNERAITKA